MAMIKNVFRRKKSLAGADGNQESSDDDGGILGDDVKRRVSVSLLHGYVIFSLLSWFSPFHGC